jgi:hypothetical protein
MFGAVEYYLGDLWENYGQAMQDAQDERLKGTAIKEIHGTRGLLGRLRFLFGLEDGQGRRDRGRAASRTGVQGSVGPETRPPGTRTDGTWSRAEGN